MVKRTIKNITEVTHGLEELEVRTLQASGALAGPTDSTKVSTFTRYGGSGIDTTSTATGKSFGYFSSLGFCQIEGIGRSQKSRSGPHCRAGKADGQGSARKKAERNKYERFGTQRLQVGDHDKRHLEERRLLSIILAVSTLQNVQCSKFRISRERFRPRVTVSLAFQVLSGLREKLCSSTPSGPGRP